MFEESYYNGVRTGTILTVAQMTQDWTSVCFISDITVTQRIPQA